MKKFLFIAALCGFSFSSAMAATVAVVSNPHSAEEMKELILDNCAGVNPDRVIPPALGLGWTEVGKVGGAVGNLLAGNSHNDLDFGSDLPAFTQAIILSTDYKGNARSFLHFENIVAMNWFTRQPVELKDLNGKAVVGPVTTSEVNDEAVLICFEQNEAAYTLRAHASYENISGSSPAVSIAIFNDK